MRRPYRGHRERVVALTLVAGMMVATGAPAAGQESSDDTEPDAVAAGSVLFEPIDGTTFEVDGRIHGGLLTVGGHDDGLSLVEELTVDDYLLGIREVPFSWETEALQAQATAARTYLAWTLERGRSASGRRYGYDICATAACQVYAGVGGLRDADGQRWRSAVAATGNELLVADGGPIQALYSSTSGLRTRAVQGVFIGAPSLPYLQPVDVPGQTSPFVTWSYVVPADHMATMLADAGLLQGSLLDVETAVPAEDDGGPWTVKVVGTEGESTIDTWTLRGRINAAAIRLFPDEYPPLRGDVGRRYPTTVLSPSYVISRAVEVVFDGGPPVYRTVYRFEGEGWGHNVGMSQFGAQAMAEAGANDAEILSHFYGGIEPVDGTDLLPPTVRVGLATGVDELTIRPDGPISVSVGGEVIAGPVLGTWRVERSGSSVRVIPPIGLGQPPRLEAWRVQQDDDGNPRTVTVRSTTAGEMTLVIRLGGRLIDRTAPVLVEAGDIVLDWRDLVGSARVSRVVDLTVIVESPEGRASRTLRFLPSAD